MESACIRVRFTPLLQKLPKEDSKHFLEIVPEITCIQNLDKIEWRREENSIEYTIPMTYKIILRKNNVIKDSYDNVETLEKTYHSCVDLLLPSLDSNLMKLETGDVNRIFSDTFVLNKVAADVKSIILKKINGDNTSDNSTMQLISAQVQTELYSYPSITSQLINGSTIESSNCKTQETSFTQTCSEVLHNESVTQVPEADICNYIKSSIDKITSTEMFPPPSNIASLRPSEINDLVAMNNKPKGKRKLNITSICSINTCDEEIKNNLTKTIPNKIVIRVLDPPNYSSEQIFQNPNSIGFLYGIHDQRCCEFVKPYDNVSSYRILPEIRVANFKLIMEREIMPLKVMLGDIFNKCSTLGVSLNKAQKSVTYINMPSSAKQINKCFKTNKQTKSNRVVYSIVFDG